MPITVEMFITGYPLLLLLLLLVLLLPYTFPHNRVPPFLTDDDVISAAGTEHLQAQDAMLVLQSLNTDRQSALYFIEKNMFKI